MYDMNSGYHGYSMIKRAVQAYQNGEKPKTKWSKKAMTEAIEDWMYRNRRIPTEDYAKLHKKELFSRYFRCSSWHHTSKYANATDFYCPDEDLLQKISRDMTEDEFQQKKAEMEEKAAKMLEYKNFIHFSTGYEFNRVGSFVAAFPDKVIEHHLSKNGNDIYTIKFGKHVFTGSADQKCKDIKSSVFLEKMYRSIAEKLHGNANLLEK